MHFFCSVFFEAYTYTDEFVLETYCDRQLFLISSIYASRLNVS